MKILFIHNKYLQSAGGEDATVDAEVDLLASKGHQVEVIYFNNEGFKAGLLNKVRGGVKAIYNKESRKVLRDKLATFRPDIIHVHNFYFNASPSIFFEANKQKIPVVATLHNYRLICVNALLLRDQQICERCVHSFFPIYGVKYGCYHESAIESAMVGTISSIHKLLGTWKKRINKFITPAEFSRNRLIDSSLGLAAGQFAVKNNFIKDPGEADHAQRAAFFLFVGRLSGEKGVDVMLKGFEGLPDQQLVIVGDGPDGAKLQAEYGHLKNVQFVGRKSNTEVLALMRTCKALVFPSICYEGLPLTIVEALATGTPVIASKLGGMAEMIRPGENGLSFEKGNPAHLREMIGQFIELTQQNTVPFYSNARKSYLDRYHPDICYQAVMDIYTEVITAFKSNSKH